MLILKRTKILIVLSLSLIVFFQLIPFILWLRPPFSRPYSRAEREQIEQAQIQSADTWLNDNPQLLGGIVQGEIVEIRTERIASGRPFFVGPLATGVTHHLYEIHTLRVDGIYREHQNIQVGDLIDIVQLKRYQRRVTRGREPRSWASLDYVRVQMSIGDQVIVILRGTRHGLPMSWEHQWQPVGFNRLGRQSVHLRSGFQSVYWYNPDWQIYGDDWFFKAVHPLNRLHLTPDDLENLTN